MKASPTDGIGIRLAYYRRLAGLSAQEVSDALGGEMSRGVIANIESGRKTDLTIDQVIALAWVLGVPFVSLALPVEKPFEWYTLVRGQGPGSWESMRSAELLNWMTRIPDPFRSERAVGINPAGVLARSMLRTLAEYHQVNNEVAGLKSKVDSDPQYGDVLGERVEERRRIHETLLALGVDMSVPEEDGNKPPHDPQVEGSHFYGFDLIDVDRLDAENWRVNYEIPDEVVERRFAGMFIDG